MIERLSFAKTGQMGRIVPKGSQIVPGVGASRYRASSLRGTMR